MGKELVIRYACAKDAAQIAAVEAECFPPEQAASPEKIAKRLNVSAEDFLLAESDGKILSFINYMPSYENELTDGMFDGEGYNRNGSRLFILSAATRTEYRRQGLVRALMAEFFKRQHEKGRREAVLTCLEDKIAFYEQFGFVNEGVSGSQHGGVSWYSMRKKI